MKAIHHLFHIQKPVADVFRAISSQEGISSWYTRTDHFEAVVGATFPLHFGELAFTFEITECIENQRITWKCIEATMPLVGHSMTYALDENDGKTRVRFTHVGFTEADDFMANMNFSSAKYLESLRQYCQTGNGEAFGSERYRS